jgi:hypothetical protein
MTSADSRFFRLRPLLPEIDRGDTPAVEVLPECRRQSALRLAGMHLDPAHADVRLHSGKTSALAPNRHDRLRWQRLASALLLNHTTARKA